MTDWLALSTKLLFFVEILSTRLLVNKIEINQMLGSKAQADESAHGMKQVLSEMSSSQPATCDYRRALVKI
jgi:hypothetical protein